MNTPSKEALDAARDLFNQRYCFASDNDNAAIIDRHFEPLRAEIVQLTIDRDNWKIRAEEMDEYKADCMELRQRAKQAIARHAAGEPAKHPDTEIIDRFEEMCGSLEYCDADEVRNHWRAYGYSGSNEGVGRTMRDALRAAIDAARKEVQP